MRIGMVLDSRFPPDIRVEKEVNLLKTEHQLFMLCPRRDAQSAEEEWQGMQIRRVFSTPERQLENLKLMATCSSSGWERAIRCYVEAFALEALHVHDLPLLGAALMVARQMGIPVVADLHEDYPQMLADALRNPKGEGFSAIWLVQRLVVSIEKWRRYETQAVPQANVVIVVIEEARDRLIRLGVAAERLRVVSNYAPLSDLDGHGPEELNEPCSSRFNVVYAGGFDAVRDLHTVIDAVALLSPDEIPDLQLILIGGVGIALNELSRYVAQKQLLDRVRLLNWRPMEEVVAHIQSSQVCLVPHVKTPFTDATIPHKLFQYMAKRRPVVVSNCVPLERIVKETGAGLVYTSGDASELAECLRRLYRDPNLRKSMGQAGYRAVRDKYNWEQTGHALLQAYRQLAQS